jgi:hypothetical protein
MKNCGASMNFSVMKRGEGKRINVTANHADAPYFGLEQALVAPA